nr:MAG TPA: hypothetical protein [Caudoviricetes sp.]DAV75866.1 MAG TPA: hypothetical protein [Caudoviricetes sp.]
MEGKERQCWLHCLSSICVSNNCYLSMSLVNDFLHK